MLTSMRNAQNKLKNQNERALSQPANFVRANTLGAIKQPHKETDDQGAKRARLEVVMMTDMLALARKELDKERLAKAKLIVLVKQKARVVDDEEWWALED